MICKNQNISETSKQKICTSLISRVGVCVCAITAKFFIFFAKLYGSTLRNLRIASAWCSNKQSPIEDSKILRKNKNKFLQKYKQHKKD